MDSQKFCLKWDGFQSSVTSLFDILRRDGDLVDVTLCCEGQRVKAHRMMLSACSPYFRELLKANQCQQMAIFLKDTSAADLSAVIEFMYKGSVNVAQSQLASFIKTAEMLQIRGLSGDDEKGAPPPSPRPAPPAAAPTPPHKRRRLSGGSAAGGRRSPVSPGRCPRTPTPPPALPPPPPPPGAAARSLSSNTEPGAHQRTSGEQHVPPATPVSVPESVKVEKVDLTEDDDDASLDSALYNVAEYEGAGGHAAEYDGGHAGEYDGSYDGSNSGLDHQMNPLMSPAEMGALAPLGAGPSQGPPGGHGMSPLTPGSQSGEDGSASGGYAYKCHICFREYKHRVSLLHHSKVHQGLTTCPRCVKVCSTVKDLRKHLVMAHGMTHAQMRDVVPTRPRCGPGEVYYPPDMQ